MKQWPTLVADPLAHNIDHAISAGAAAATGDELEMHGFTG
jgi:hypothetical protein